jgi:hypothetical protein
VILQVPGTLSGPMRNAAIFWILRLRLRMTFVPFSQGM